MQAIVVCRQVAKHALLCVQLNEVFANNATLTMLTYLTYLSTLCYSLGDITSCVSSGSGGAGGHAPRPVKISHKKDWRQRQPHRFHVSRPPYPATGSATVCTGHISFLMCDY